MSTQDNNFFDAIVIGTGLAESIFVAALSKAGFRVAHIDANPYYGGNEASLSQEETIQWGKRVSDGQQPPFSSYSGSSEVIPFSRQYSICLKPAVIPSVGPFINSLVASGVSKYSGFKLLDSLSIYSSEGLIKSVPASKEDIFNSKDISLIEKRRLMRFLAFAGSDFEGKPEIQGKEETPFRDFLRTAYNLSDPTITVILYALAHSITPDDLTMPSLLRLRRYLRSVGRYGPSPFLIGHYGGIGDLSQGFCRAAAVAGAVYILGRPIASVVYHAASASHPDEGGHFEVVLEDFAEVLKSRIVVSSKHNMPAVPPIAGFLVPTPSPLPPTPSVIKVARCIAILDQPVDFGTSKYPSPDSVESASTGPVVVDSGVIIFPPLSWDSRHPTSTTVFINGEGTLSTPKNRWIIYIIHPLTALVEETPEDLLKPCLNAVLRFAISVEDGPTVPLSTSFYYEDLERPIPLGASPPSSEASPYLVMPTPPFSLFPDLPDDATRCAEATYQVAVRRLRALDGRPVQEDEEIDFWPPLPFEENSDDEA